MTDASADAAAGSGVATATTRSRSFVLLPNLRGLRYFLGLLPLCAGLGLWQLLGSASSAYYPPPSSWWDAVRPLWDTGQLAPALRATLKAVGLSLLLATMIGGAIGFVLGRYRVVDRSLSVTLEFLRAVPPAAVVPVFVLLIGYNDRMKLAVVVFAAIWPVLLSTRSATLRISSRHFDVAKTFQMSELSTLRKMVIPSLIPAIFAGVRVAAPLTLIITLLVEILTQVQGIGALLSIAQHSFNPAQAYGLVALVACIALVINVLVNVLEAAVYRRFPSARRG